MMILLDFNPTIIYLIGYLAAAIAGLALTAWVFSWFFAPGKQLKHLQVQTKLMVKMAEKAGVSADDIDGALNILLM